MQVKILTGPARGKRLCLQLRWQWQYWLGIAEPDVEQVLRRFVVPGSVVFDVGAHVGYFSVLCSVLSKGGRVVAIEPNPANIDLLQRTINANPGLDICIVPKAASSGMGWTEFVLYEKEKEIHNPSMLGRLQDVAPRGQDIGNKILVETITLDSIAISAGLWPNVVKIDTEGAEALVVSGMRAILAHRPYPIIIIEFHNEKSEAECIDLLRKDGFQVLPILESETKPHYPYHVLAMKVG